MSHHQTRRPRQTTRSHNRNLDRFERIFHNSVFIPSRNDFMTRQEQEEAATRAIDTFHDMSQDMAHTA